MKRWAIGLAVFSTSLGLGLLTAVLLHPPDRALGEPDQNGIPKIVVNESVLASVPRITNSLTADVNRDRAKRDFLEAFTDDSEIGRPGRNKIEIRCFEHGDDITAQIKFYSRKNGGAWEQKQSFEFKNYGPFGCDPEVKDYNNDGLKDFTYKSDVAARGANELRTLFIYNKKTDELVHIKNSGDYPNLAYNKKLDCLDAWLFHGATTTVFLKLEGDVLRPFASVNTGLERVVTVIEKDGTERIVSRKKMHEDDIYTRYSSFDPPRP